MDGIGVISYVSCAIAFSVLTIILLISWRGKVQGGALLAASVLSIIWAVYASYEATTIYVETISLALVELLRSSGWLIFLFIILFPFVIKSRNRWSFILLLMVSLVSVATVATLLSIVSFGSQYFSSDTVFEALVFSNLIIAVIGLTLVEQLYRNASSDRRWSLKFLCLGVGGLFIFDLYFYADALLLREMDSNIWSARGFINALVAPLIAVSAARNPDWSLDVFVSRQLVFHTATLMAVGVYLVAMAAGGYYIKVYGGSWGGVVQLIFLFGGFIVLALLLFSGQIRASVRVYFSKHFFNYRYDYREEWLKFINALSGRDTDEGVHERVIGAIGEIVESPGGVLWLRRKEGDFRLVSNLNMSVDEQLVDNTEQESLVNFLKNKQWVIDIDDYMNEPAIYGDLSLPGWLQNLPQAWLVVPLLQQSSLYGFLVLARSRANMSINWENRDLLKTTGRQAANYLALMDANEELVDSRQFETFNRLSAYVVHDLKNVMAQLALVVKNAKRHKDNQDFVEDAFQTVDNAVKKMNRMLGQLRQGRNTSNVQAEDLTRLNLLKLARQVIQNRSIEKPVPVLESEVEEVMVFANEDQLNSVIGHLVQNAQEATPDGGNVTLRISISDQIVIIEIEDNGSGMDKQFIRERLFRPFDTTKGNAGMGIGVYESREYVLSMGGKFDVVSSLDEGTTFKIKLKIVDQLPHATDQLQNTIVVK